MSSRFIEPELLDHASDEDVATCLRDLRRINRWFGGESTLRRALRGYEKASILDVGAASGEVARLLPNARVTSLDLQFRNLHTAPKPAVCADAFRLPFADRSIDVVACTLFLHHFQNDAAVALLKEFARVVCFSGVIVADLERHWIAERFLPFTRPLFGWSKVTVHDGSISVRAAFKPDELTALSLRAGLGQVRVRRHIPWFRLSLIGNPNGGK